MKGAQCDRSCVRSFSPRELHIWLLAPVQDGKKKKPQTQLSASNYSHVAFLFFWVTHWLWWAKKKNKVKQKEKKHDGRRAIKCDTCLSVFLQLWHVSYTCPIYNQHKTYAAVSTTHGTRAKRSRSTPRKFQTTALSLNPVACQWHPMDTNRKRKKMNKNQTLED